MELYRILKIKMGRMEQCVRANEIYLTRYEITLYLISKMYGFWMKNKKQAMNPIPFFKWLKWKQRLSVKIFN